MIKNIISNWSSVVLSVIGVYFLYPFFVETLGEEQYGVWLLISSATGYFSLLQMGIPMANVKFLSKYYAQKDYENVNKVICTNLFFFTIGAIIIFICGFFLAYFLGIVFTIPEKYIEISQIAIILVCLEISIRFSFEVFEGLFHAQQKFVAFNIIKNIFIIIRILITFLIVKNDNGLILVAITLLLVTVLQSIIFYFYMKRVNKFIKIKFKHIDKGVFREVFNYSIFVLLLQLATKISFHTDSLVVGSVVSISAVVWFNIGNNMMLYFMKLISGISHVIMPRISALDASGVLGSVSDVYCRYSRALMFFVLPFCLSFWCVGADFIALWMGAQYRILSGNVLSILTIGYLFFLVQSGVAVPILMGLSKVKFPTMLIFMSSLMNLVISIVLGRSYGIYGVAWGTTIPMLIVVILLIIYMSITFNVNIFYYSMNAIIQPFYSSIPFVLMHIVVSQYVKPDSYLNLLFIFIVCNVSYVLFAYAFILKSEEKKILLNYMNKEA